MAASKYNPYSSLWVGRRGGGEQTLSERCGTKRRFQAYRIYETNGDVSARVESLQLDDLSAGEVTVRVHYSTINYKDALAATGKGKILRRSPLVGGIDLSGEVLASEDSRYRRGDLVLVTGCAFSPSEV